MVQTLILILNYSNKHILLVYGDQARAYPPPDRGKSWPGATLTTLISASYCPTA